MILSDKKILEEINRGNIVIDPFDRENLGTNSYDVHLGKYLAVYEHDILDAKTHNKIIQIEIPEEGYLLLPSKLYLGVTKEYTETAGKGDAVFCNTWTLEISVRQPVRIYCGMSIGQIIYFEISEEIEILYNIKKMLSITAEQPFLLNQ